jgi:hypothetical protein
MYNPTNSCSKVSKYFKEQKRFLKRQRKKKKTAKNLDASRHGWEA